MLGCTVGLCVCVSVCVYVCVYVCVCVCVCVCVKVLPHLLNFTSWWGASNTDIKVLSLEKPELSAVLL